MDETAAREVVLVRVLDRAEPESPQWTVADRAWASRVAAETVGTGATPEAFLASRAHAALQRLLPRDRPASAGAWRWLQRPLWRATWVLVAIAAGFIVGALVDRVGGDQHINLLAPPAWALVLWNAGVYVLLLVGAVVGLMRRRPAAPGPIAGLVRKAVQRGSDMRAPRGLDELGLTRAWPAFAADWLQASAPLTAARASAVLHAGAAALAAGLFTGLYLRGLVLDYRAGWQSTFLDAADVQALLGTLFAPASRLSGVALPDLAGVEALRLVPGASGPAVEPAGGGSAAPWIHLYAWTLGLAVVLPRTVLALWSLARARRLSRRFPLPLHEPYFQQLLRQLRSGAARVRLTPHAQAPSAQATLALRDICARVWGDRVQIDVDAAVGFGDEERAAAPATAAADLAAAIVLFDMGATPEAEQQGRLVRRLADTLPAGVPLLLLVDEAAFRTRFATLDDRLAQRRAAWAALARSFGTAAVFLDLSAPDLAVAERMLQAAIDRPVQRGAT